MEGGKEELRDMDEILIPENLSEERKREKYMEQAFPKHRNEGYVVNVHFDENGCSATEAVEYYLNQIVELRY